MHRILVILGPTSTNKTDLALNLARKFNGELISCDSRQVYVGLDIGTGKYPSIKCKVQNAKLKKQNGFWEIDKTTIWMYDVLDTSKQYTVYDYVKEAKKVIDSMLKKGKLPIVVGGTGLYLRALIDGLPNLSIPINKTLRKKLQNLSKEELQKQLQKEYPDKWESLNESDRQNPRRLMRAFELILMEPKRQTKQWFGLNNFDILKIGLIAPRQILYRRIDERVINRIKSGMINEAKNLHKRGLSFERMKQLGLEYGILADYLSGRIKSKSGLIELLQNKIHHFARRQITWFKKEKQVNWFDITGKEFAKNVENLVAKWYYQTDAS